LRSCLAENIGNGSTTEKEDGCWGRQGGDARDATLLPFLTRELPVMGAGSFRSFRSCWENACLCKNWLGACWFVLPGHLILSYSSVRKLYGELCQGIVDVAISSVFPLNDTGQKTSQPSSVFIKL